MMLLKIQKPPIMLQVVPKGNLSFLNMCDFWIGKMLVILTMINWRMQIHWNAHGSVTKKRYILLRECIIVFTNHRVTRCDDTAVKRSVFRHGHFSFLKIYKVMKLRGDKRFHKNYYVWILSKSFGGPGSSLFKITF